MLGLSPRVPRFVKKFGKVGEAIEGAIRAYAEDVRTRRFPDARAHLCHEGAMKSAMKSAKAARRIARSCALPRRDQSHEKAENPEQQGLRDDAGEPL